MKNSARSKRGPKPLALVTGGASPLGSAISRALAQAGYDLVLHYGSSKARALELADELREGGAKVFLLQADLRKPASLARALARGPRDLSRTSLLVNNASFFGPTPAFNEKAWDAILHINLLSPYALSEALRPQLQNNKGSVVNITDIYGAHPLLKDHPAYCASKGGLITLTRFMASQWGPGVRVNGVSPGVISFPAHYGAAKKKKLAEKSALKRGGAPEDIARAVLYLAEQPFVTGQILNVDGGRFL